MLLFDNVNRLMTDGNVSNEVLAQYISERSGDKTSREAVRKWRNGINFPPIDKAQIIAEYFNVSLDNLMGTPLNTEQIIKLPLVGAVNAGPFDIINDAEWTDNRSVSVRLLQGRSKKECVAIEVIGDSMSPYLLPGDILVVHRQSYAVNGNIIVAYDPTANGYTVKRFEQTGDTVKLLPFNSNYEPYIYTNPTEQELNLYGVCVGLERKLV